MTEKSKVLFYKSLSEVNYFWISLSLLIGLLSYYSRAYRWKYALEPMGYESSSKNRFYAVMIGYMINLTLPRAGEASRAVALSKSDGIPFTVGFGTIVSERIVDVIFLLGITFFSFLLGQEDFMRIRGLIGDYFGPKSESTSFTLYIVMIFIILSGIVIYAVNQKIRNKIREVAVSLYQSAISVFKTKNPLAYILHSLLIWTCFLVMFYLPFLAFDSTKELPLSCVLLAFVAGSLGISLTNGGLGSYPLLVGIVVAYFLTDLPKDEAFAIGNALGLIIWVSQTLLLIVLGLISWFLIPKKI
jgi:uncharacterized protein (TIRG00374 family)